MDDRDRQKLHNLIQAVERAYERPRLLAWRGFIYGLFTGLGATLGAALILTILTFFLRSLGGLPVIGEWFNAVGQNLPRIKP